MKIGILTFHCSDNVGAMLQAYGLKQYLISQGFEVDIVNYSPLFMTGRHWLIPYVPMGSLRDRGRYALREFKIRIRDFDSFRGRRRAMSAFRKKKLLRASRLGLLFKWQLFFDRSDVYIVGSDQIWNPEITCGLRPVYFGNFPRLKSGKQKVIAYAASLGASEIPEEYCNQFEKLLKHVDAISMREESALPFVEQFTDRPVIAVPDPVFLLEKEQWSLLAEEYAIPLPDHYIVYYNTENKWDAKQFAEKLSLEEDIPIISIHDSREIDMGPGEFLYCLAHADYVVTSSFHATAFSIILQKKFVTFLHSTLGARLENVLYKHGLEGRIWHPDFDIHEDIDWRKVMICTEDMKKPATDWMR